MNENDKDEKLKRHEELKRIAQQEFDRAWSHPGLIPIGPGTWISDIDATQRRKELRELRDREPNLEAKP